MLLIAGQERGDSRFEMLVPSMSGDEQGMAQLIVQQQERSAAQDNAAFTRSVHAGGACHRKQACDGRLRSKSAHGGIGDVQLLLLPLLGARGG